MEEIKPKRTFVCTDIHGVGLELKELLNKANIQPGKDQLIISGDLFDRGQHSHLVWEVIQKYNPLAVIGNHEVKYLKYLNEEMDENRLPPHYFWALNNLIEHGVKVRDFYDYLNSLPLLLDYNGTIIAHAGILPDNPLQPNVSANVYGHFSPLEKMPIPKDDDGNDYWWKHYEGDNLVLYGHLASHDYLPRINKNSKGKINSIGLDTAAVHGHNITGYVIEEEKFYSCKVEKDYFSELKQIFKKTPQKPHPLLKEWFKEQKIYSVTNMY